MLSTEHFVLRVSRLPRYLVSPWLASVTCGGHVMRSAGLILFIVRGISLSTTIKLTLSMRKLKFGGVGDRVKVLVGIEPDV